MKATFKKNELIRFIGIGGVNTLFTFILYQTLMFYLSEPISYIISWFVGVIIVVTFYPKKVFSVSRISLFGRFLLGFNYIFVFFVGLILINFLSSIMQGSRLSILLVLVVTTSVGFISSKYITQRTRSADE